MSGPVLPGYTLGERLGGHGSEVLYRARQHSLDREVVVHLWNVQEDEVAQRKALAAYDALRRLAALNQPHLVRIHDMGRLGSRGYFYVREYVQGESLRARLERKGALPEQEALMLAENVAHALRDAWDNAGIGHAGLSPGCVLIGLDGLVKLSGVVHPDRPDAVKLADGLRALGLLLVEMVQPEARRSSGGVTKGLSLPADECSAETSRALLERLLAPEGVQGFPGWDAALAEIGRACEAVVPAEGEVVTSVSGAAGGSPWRKGIFSALAITAAGGLIAIGIYHGRSRDQGLSPVPEVEPELHEEVAPSEIVVSAAPDAELPDPHEHPGSLQDDTPEAGELPPAELPEEESDAPLEPPAEIPEEPGMHRLAPDHPAAMHVAYGRWVETLLDATRVGRLEEAFEALKTKQKGREAEGFEPGILEEDRKALETLADLRALMLHGAERLAGMVLRSDPERPWVVRGVEGNDLVLALEREEQPIVRHTSLFEMEELEWVLLMNRIDPARLLEHQAAWHLARGEFRPADAVLERAEQLEEDTHALRAWLQRWQGALADASADRLMVSLLDHLDSGAAEDARRLYQQLSRRYAESVVVRQSPDLMELLRLYSTLGTPVETEP